MNASDFSSAKSRGEAKGQCVGRAASQTHLPDPCRRANVDTPCTTGLTKRIPDIPIMVIGFLQGSNKWRRRMQSDQGHRIPLPSWLPTASRPYGQLKFCR